MSKQARELVERIEVEGAIVPTNGTELIATVAKRDTLGSIVFWTLPDADKIDSNALKAIMESAKCPDWMIGAAVKVQSPQAGFSAACRAMSLTASGVYPAGLLASEASAGATAQWLARPMREDRVLLRETFDSAGKRIGTAQHGVLSVDEVGNVKAIWNDATWESQNIADDATAETVADDSTIVRHDARKLLSALQSATLERVGKTNSYSLRMSIQQWLTLAGRVTLRDSGGVYYVPSTSALYSELESIRETVDSDVIAGSMMLIDVVDRTSTTVSAIADAAQSELESDIAAIAKALEIAAGNLEKEDGEKVLSVKSSVSECDAIGAKLAALVQLFPSVKVLESRLAGLRATAETMQSAAQEKTPAARKDARATAVIRSLDASVIVEKMTPEQLTALQAALTAQLAALQSAVVPAL